MKRASAIAVAFMVAASASLLTAASPASAQSWRELVSDRMEQGSCLRDLLQDRMQSRADLRELIMDKLAERAALRDLLKDRMERRSHIAISSRTACKPGRYPRSSFGPDGAAKTCANSLWTAWRTAAAAIEKV